MLELKIIREAIEIFLAVSFGILCYQVMANSALPFFNAIAVTLGWLGFFWVLYCCSWYETKFKAKILRQMEIVI